MEQIWNVSLTILSYALRGVHVTFLSIFQFIYSKEQLKAAAEDVRNYHYSFHLLWEFFFFFLLSVLFLPSSPSPSPFSPFSFSPSFPLSSFPLPPLSPSFLLSLFSSPPPFCPSLYLSYFSSFFLFSPLTLLAYPPSSSLFSSSPHIPIASSVTNRGSSQPQKKQTEGCRSTSLA